MKNFASLYPYQYQFHYLVYLIDPLLFHLFMNLFFFQVALSYHYSTYLKNSYYLLMSHRFFFFFFNYLFIILEIQTAYYLGYYWYLLINLFKLMGLIHLSILIQWIFFNQMILRLKFLYLFMFFICLIILLRSNFYFEYY